MKKIKKFLEDNNVEIVSLISILLLFYLMLVMGGISTHDELQSIYKYQTHKWTEFDQGYLSRWGMFVFGILPTYVQAMSTSMWVYRLFTIIGLIFPNLMLMLLLYKHIDKKSIWLYPMIFFMFAQININEHNGLYSFAFNYQYVIGFLFLSLNLYLSYLKNKKRKYLIWSAIFYLIVSMSYEAFVVFGMVYFLISFYYHWKRNELNISILIKDLFLHASLVMLYVLSYYVIRNLFGAVNVDSEIGSNLTLGKVIKTMVTFAFGQFPLRMKYYNISESIKMMFSINPASIIRLFVIILLSYVVVTIVSKIKYKISFNKYILLSILLLLCTLLSTFLIAITGRFVGWAESGVKSFGISYYSYYFIIAWIILSITYSYQIIKWKKIASIILFIIIFIITGITQVNNEYYTKQLNMYQTKINLLNDIITTQGFMEIEEDAVIYASNYTGIHNNIDTISEYIYGVTGKHVEFLNDYNNIDFNKPVYIFTINQESKVGMLARVKKGTSNYIDKVIIYSENSIDNYKFIADIDTEQDVYKNESYEGTYSDYIVTNNLDSKDNYVEYRFNSVLIGSYDFVKY